MLDSVSSWGGSVSAPRILQMFDVSREIVTALTGRSGSSGLVTLWVPEIFSIVYNTVRDTPH